MIIPECGLGSGLPRTAQADRLAVGLESKELIQREVVDVSEGVKID